MITQFTCTCGANKPTDAKFYDGWLGYEAIVCKQCGRYYDHDSSHEPDDWSKSFVNLKTMDTIKFHSGLFDVTMTSDEVRQMYEDIQFLQDCVLMLTNPEVAEKSDMYFSNQQRKQYIKEYFTGKKRGYSEAFIKQIFQS